MRLDVILDDELAALLRRLAEQRGATFSDLVRSSVKLAVQLETERAVHAARAGTARRCVVCEMPRRADGVEDALAHAQCDQIVANLERASS